MNSIPTPEAIESNNPLVTRADEQIARAHEQIRHADEQLARVTEQLAKMGLDTAHPPSAAPVPDPKPPPGRPVRRALVGLLLLSCVAVAALFSQSSWAKRIAARWAPQFVSAASLTREDPAPPAASPAQLAPAEAATPRATPPAQTAAQDAKPAAAATLPDQTQLQQTLARDLANVQRDIEQLKATQQQIASDNSKAIEQLKASQEEMKRQLATISAQNLSRTPQQNLSRTLPPPAQPTAISRKPKPRPYPPYERARIPSQWDYEEW